VTSRKARGPALALAGTLLMGTLTVAPPIQVAYAAPSSSCSPDLSGADTVAPQVATLSMGKTLDLRDTHPRVPVTVHAVDVGGSGVRSIELTAESPYDGAAEDSEPSFLRATLHLAAGTHEDGTWTGAFTLTQPGRLTWDNSQPYPMYVKDVRISDQTGNVQDYLGITEPPVVGGQLYLAPRTFEDRSFVVHPSDRTGTLRLADLTVRPRTVDTRHHARRVTFVASFSGHPVFGRRPTYVAVALGESSTRAATHVDLHPAPGGGDRWVGHLEVLRHRSAELRARAYPLSVAWDERPVRSSYDDADGSGERTTSQLRKAGLPSRIRFLGPVDATAPTLSGATVDPTPVDVTDGPGLVTVTMQAQDSLSGIDPRRLHVGFPHRPDVASAIDLMGVPWSPTGPYVQTSRGTWQATVTVPRCRVFDVPTDGATAQDRAGNQRSLGDADLGDLRLTSTAQGDTTNPRVSTATADLSSRSVTIDFDEGVRGASADNLTLYDYGEVRRASDAPDYGYPVTQPTAWRPTSVVCRDDDGSVACDGSDGLATQVVATFADLPAAQLGYLLDVNDGGVTPQLVDGGGNPVLWGGTTRVPAG
jgi:hypothetical protein